MSKTLVIDALNDRENTLQATRDELQRQRDRAVAVIIRLDIELTALGVNITDVQTAKTTAEKDIP